MKSQTPRNQPAATQSFPAGGGENAFSHFDDAQRELVVVDPRTPTKWINYVGTLDFGGFVDQTGGMNLCKRDPANNRVTGYRIDAPPNAPRGSTLYARTTAPDGVRAIFSPFFTPTLGSFERFECRMGLGYNRWIVRMHGFEFEILIFVPAGASQAILDVKVRNVSAPPGTKLDLAPLVEFSHPDALKNLTNADWVPQTMKGKAVGDVIIQYPHMAEGRRANFLTGDRPFDSFTTDRNHFLGRYGYGTFQAPGGLLAEHLDNYEAPRADNGNSIAAILYRLGTIEPGKEERLILQLGQGSGAADQAEAIARFRDPARVDEAFQTLKGNWRAYLDRFREVKTPDAALDRVINVLGPRQNHATFFWSRYMSLNQLGYGGDRGIGVRDSNQDLLGVLPYMPEQARQMIERLLSVQRHDGSSMHQFNPLTMKASIGEGHPGSDQDFYSDDHLWNVLAVIEYIKETGNLAFLEQHVPYYEEGPGEPKSGPVLEHLHRALAFTAGNLGRHGLPNLGWADWNDAFNMEGAESVFSACLYGKALLEMQDLMGLLGDGRSARGYAEDYARMRKNINRNAWDGGWYVSYIGKDGRPFGSKENEEGQIYLYTQAWAVIAGFAPPDRAARAMLSVKERLDTEHGIKVMTPAYKTTLPGISASTYAPGLKENGGVFLHPNPWASIAEAMLGNGDRAVQIIDRILPHKQDPRIYECQPDVFVQNMAGDEHPQFGLARNPWLSGTVSWVNQALTKHILGIRPAFDGLIVDPVLPAGWPGYTATRVFRGVTCRIRVERGAERDCVVLVDGVSVAGGLIPMAMLKERTETEIVVRLGVKAPVPLLTRMAQESEARRAAAALAQDRGPLKPDELHTLDGAQAKTIYLFRKMGVHAQGLSATLDFPPTGVVTGAPTLATGVSPFGQVNHLLDAGRSIRFGKRMRFASTPAITVSQVGKTATRLLTNLRRDEEDERGEEPQAYPDSLADEAVSVTLAPPLMISRYEMDKVRIVRTTVSPELAGSEADVTVPATVDMFELANTGAEERTVTLVLPRPSLVNLAEKKLRAEQDNAFGSQGATRDHVHATFQSTGGHGIVMGSRRSGDRMAIAVPELPGVAVDLQTAFRTAAYKTDLLTDSQGRFTARKSPETTFECGAAIAVTVVLAPGARMEIPFATVLDFPQHSYVDGKSFPRAYTRRFPEQEGNPGAHPEAHPEADEGARAIAMAEWALREYPRWIGRAQAIQAQVFAAVRQDPEYADDRPGAVRVVNLLLNELSYLLANAAIWTDGAAAFLECFDYPFLNSADVDWYSLLMLMVFPDKEKAICQKFIDSIESHDDTETHYHWHAASAQMRVEYEEWRALKSSIASGRVLEPGQASRFEYLEFEADVGDGRHGYRDRSLTHIRGPKKLKGSVSHDVGRLTAGNPLRGNVSEYDWFNTNYWVDLFPKLAQRVARDAKLTNDPVFVARNWAALRTGFAYWVGLDRDGDGIPEGNPGEVKNTFDNIKLFGYDSYSASMALAGYKSMILMAEMLLAAASNEADRSGLRAQIADFQARFAKAQATTETLWVKTRRADGSEGGYFATCYDPKIQSGELAVVPRNGALAAYSDQLARYRYISEEGWAIDRAAFEALPDARAMRLVPLADKDFVYSGLRNILDRASADYAELERNGYVAKGEIQAKFWDVPAEAALKGTYSDRPAVFAALRAHKSFDVFANQLDGLWAWIAMGEAPEELLHPARVRMILETIYRHNRVTNGWATQRKADGGEVESDQGKDVWIATNYVLAQMLDFYGMAEASKEVYQVMDEVLLQRDNTSTSPESIRPDENKFIVKGYPRPGAVWTQLPLFFLKARKRAGGKNATAAELAGFIQGIFNPPAVSTGFPGESGESAESGADPAPGGRIEGRLPYGLSRIRPGAAQGNILPGGGGAAGSVLA
ncbi:MAG: GH116 family glycosyl hydrolase [Fibrobacteria bacterium]